MNRALLILSASLIAVGSSAMTHPVQAQHFAKPDAINPEARLKIAEPVFGIARSTTSFGSVVHDSWLYVMGGYTGRPHNYYHEAQSRDFYRINLLDPTHVEALPDTQGLQSCPLETWNDQIIVTGGLLALNTKEEQQSLKSLDTVRSFDPLSGKWNDLPQLPVARSSHDTAIVGSKLYAIGGWALDDPNGAKDWIQEVHVIDLQEPDAGWTAFETPLKRRAHASVAVDHRIVVIGGLTPNDGTTSSVDIFDTSTGEWTKGPEYPGRAFGIAAESHNGRIIASGSDGIVYSWQPGNSDEWEPVATLTFPRFFHQIAADARNQLYFLGGISRGIRPVHVERITLGDTPTASPIVAHWTVPSPSLAKNRQGMFIENGWIYAFGGNNSTGQHDFQPENFLREGYRLSLAGLRWRQIEPLPAARQTIQTVRTTNGSSSLAVGGFGHDGEVARTFAEAFQFDHKQGAWKELGEVLPNPRSQFGLIEHRGAYWVFGGLDYDSRRDRGDHFRHLLPILSANASDKKLEFAETGLELPRPRRAFGGAELGGKYYLVGGMRENFTIVEECDVFDFEEQAFSQIAKPSRPRLSPTLVELGGKLYLAGGSSPRSNGEGLEPNSSIEVYDPDLGTWTTLIDEIPISPRHMRVMPFRGRLLLISSHVDESDMTHLVLINTTASESANHQDRMAVKNH